MEDRAQETELCTAHLLHIIVESAYGKAWNVVILPKPFGILARQTATSLEA